MVPLPIDSFLPDIVAKVRAARSLVLVAEPGAGKTTRVPPAILRGGVLSNENPLTVVLQPRRVAARTVAARIADENGWPLGGPVGYHVRFDRRVGPDTVLRVVTEGILTRQLLDDPFLEGVGSVVLDEFHERSLYTDVAIALLREVQQTVRPDLCIVVMSATLDAEPVAAYLGGCPVVRVPGRTYPVEISYVADASPLPNGVANAVERAIESGGGDVLAFLPGAEEIRRTAAALESLAHRHDLAVLPLYGALPPGEQNLALRPDPRGRRKVVLATNIAETSLTIDGVRTVVDGGFARVASYDPERGLDRLDLQRISRAAADQRAGRAGRTGPGRCVRVWAEREKLAPFELPDIRRVDLAGTVLSLHAWGKPDVRGFGWYEPPSEESVAAAERLLDMLGALGNGRITPMGKRLANMPAHPRLGRLLIAAAGRGLLREGATMAALVSEKDIVLPGRRGDGQGGPRGPTTAGTSDLIHRMELLDEAERQRFAGHLFDRGIDPGAARSACQVRDELLRVGRSLGTRDGAATASEEDLLRLPLNAYPDRVCRRREKDPAAGAIVGGGGVRLAPESAVRQGEFFLAVDLRHDPWSATREATVRVASRLKPAWLAETFPGSVRKERGAEYDADRERVVGFVRTWYRDLIMADEPNAAVDAATAGVALAAALRPRAAELLAADEAAADLLARVSLLRSHLSQHSWPTFDEAELGDVLAEACDGKRSLEELRRGGTLAAAIRNRLIYPLDRVLEEQAPDGIVVPSGNRIRLEYAASGPPVLAVRLQELFGWTETPRIAGGRVRVRLHLLGPNYRPVQVTEDLANFWATTYFQVRKDLRVRYPKHSWPEEPLGAQAEARGRPRQ
jgi:ATP-dependent helicase HrpB